LWRRWSTTQAQRRVRRSREVAVEVESNGRLIYFVIWLQKELDRALLVSASDAPHSTIGSSANEGAQGVYAVCAKPSVEFSKHRRGLQADGLRQGLPAPVPEELTVTDVPDALRSIDVTRASSEFRRPEREELLGRSERTVDAFVPRLEVHERSVRETAKVLGRALVKQVSSIPVVPGLRRVGEQIRVVTKELEGRRRAGSMDEQRLADLCTGVPQNLFGGRRSAVDRSGSRA
jgi:hypothetical protein